MPADPGSTEQRLSVELPAGMVRVAELETARLPLVARVEPWEPGDRFRPNLNVEVTEATPECATIQQLSGVVIAARLALGVHVIACDAWRAQDRDGRRVTSIYPGDDSTVIELQYLALCGNLPLVLSLQHDASALAWGEAAFERAVWSLRWEWGNAAAPEPDPARMPALDEYALTRGESLERLSHIRGLQPFKPAGQQLKRPRSLLPGRGRKLAAELRTDTEPRPLKLQIAQTHKAATIEGDPPSRYAGSGAVEEVVPTRTLPIVLARWLGVSPAWGFGFDAQGRSEVIAAALFDARMLDPRTPAPGSDAELARVWSQPWELALMRDGQHRLEVLTTPQAGSFTVLRRGAELQLAILPSFSYLKALLKLSGFAL